MKLVMDINKAKSEINWVIRVVKSVKSREQLETALKCYFLWELKHFTEKKSHPLKSHLKSEFWACFRNKESQFSHVKDITN